MPKPTDLPVWATDTNYADGPFVNQPTKTEPSSTKQARGWDPEEEPAAESLNWWQNLVYLWLLFLDGLFSTSGGLTHFTIDGDATARDHKHGNRVLILPGMSAVSSSANYSYDTTKGFVASTGATILYWAIPLKIGDRVKTLTYAYRGDGAADITAVNVRTYDSLTDTTATIGTSSHTNPGATFADGTINVTDTTLTDTLTMWVEFSCSATGINIAGLRVTYDRP